MSADQAVISMGEIEEVADGDTKIPDPFTIIALSASVKRWWRARMKDGFAGNDSLNMTVLTCIPSFGMMVDA